MKRLLVTTLAVGLLAGCSSDTTVKEVEPKAEIKEESKLSKVVEKRKQDETIAIGNYSNQMSPIIDDWVLILDSISELSTMGANNPNLMLTQDYMEAAYAISGAIYGVDTRFKQVSVPDVEKVKASHTYIELAAEDLLYIADIYPMAIENLDVDMLTRATEAMDRVGQNMEQARLALLGEGL